MADAIEAFDSAEAEHVVDFEEELEEEATLEIYEGGWSDDRMEGHGTFWYTDGEVAVCQFKGNHQIGAGTRWSADGSTAWKLIAGLPTKVITLRDAAKIAKAIGERVPIEESSLEVIQS